MELQDLPIETRKFASPETSRLSAELSKIEQEDKSQSYLSRMLTALSEGIHGRSQSKQNLETLRSSLLLSNMTGDLEGAAKMSNQVDPAINQSLESRRSALTWSQHTGAFVKSLGLFFPGRGGYALSTLSSAADASRPDDSISRQGVDALLGGVKGAALKLGFDKIGQSQMNLASKAAGLSLANRFAELTFNSHSYENPLTGEFEPVAGLQRNLTALADPVQLANDGLVFGAGYLLVRRLGISPELVKANPLAAQAVTGAGFGFSSGFFHELQTQKKLGLDTDLSSLLQSGARQMLLDGTAAAIGAYRLAQIRSASSPELISEPAGTKAGLPLELSKHVESVLGFEKSSVFQPRPLPGDKTLSQPLNLSKLEASGKAALASTAEPAQIQSASLNLTRGGPAREFVVSENVSGLMDAMKAGGKGAEALLRVREVLPESSPNGQARLGPEQSLLIRHLEPGMKLRAKIDADLLASCSPELLRAMGRADLAARHLFPEAGLAPLYLQVPGSKRLRFLLPEALKDPLLANEAKLELGPRHKELRSEPDSAKGMTVSEWLNSIDKNHRMSDLHDVRLIARALQDLKLPVERYLGGGAESIVFQLKERPGKIDSVLKVTDKSFDPSWGGRRLRLDDGTQVVFDAPILGRRQEIQLDGASVSYYLQARGQTPVKLSDLRNFSRLLERDGKFVFWDNDMSSWGQSQLAYIPLLKLKDGSPVGVPVGKGRALALIDYDAVRILGQEPKQKGGGSWRFGNYDFEPLSR